MNDRLQLLLEAQRVFEALRELRRLGPVPPPLPRIELLPQLTGRF